MSFEEQFKDLVRPLIRETIQEELTTITTSDRKVMAEPEKWLTVPQACKEFGCTRQVLYKALATNSIPSMRPDDVRRTYILRRDVAAYLQTLHIRSNADSVNYDFVEK